MQKRLLFRVPFFLPAYQKLFHKTLAFGAKVYYNKINKTKKTEKKHMEYGLQLFSVRDAMEKDVEGTLKAVAQIGYKSVEFAGLFGNSPEQVRAWLDDCGLICTGTHTQFADLENDYEGIVDLHRTLGCNTIIIPWYTLSNGEQMQYFLQHANAMQARLAKDGMHLAYHNHAHEFGYTEDGIAPFSYLECASTLDLELDTYWAFVGKTNPVLVMERLKDRIRFIHVKDGIADGSCGKPLGQGEAPVAVVAKKAAELGIPMIVESENLLPDGLTEARTCFEYLKALNEF